MDQLLSRYLGFAEYWSQLWFVFWIYLLLGAVVINFLYSGMLYYVAQPDTQALSRLTALLLVNGLLLFHGVSSFLLVWRASRKKVFYIQIPSRIFSFVYAAVNVVASLAYPYMWIVLRFSLY